MLTIGLKRFFISELSFINYNKNIWEHLVNHLQEKLVKTLENG